MMTAACLQAYELLHRQLALVALRRLLALVALRRLLALVVLCRQLALQRRLLSLVVLELLCHPPALALTLGLAK